MCELYYMNFRINVSIGFKSNLINHNKDISKRCYIAIYDQVFI
jgi:hypothetical protein